MTIFIEVSTQFADALLVCIKTRLRALGAKNWGLIFRKGSVQTCFGGPYASYAKGIGVVIPGSD
jgi:hypothetical protein